MDSIKAAFRVCGQSRTTLGEISNTRAASLPMFTRSGSSELVTISWNDSDRALTSETGFPLMFSVIIEAEAVEMAQPLPEKETLCTLPFSMRR